MKVLLINGSPNENGCTFTALSEVAKALEQENVQTEIIQLGKSPALDCVACFKCSDLDNECIFNNDEVNAIIKKIAQADGLVVGSAVYYAHPVGKILSVLNRVFFAASDAFKGKPAAAVVSARRAGTTAAIDVLNKYFTIAQMPVVSSSYWNMVHGFKPEDVMKDEEGLQTMRNLGRNMAWMIKCIEAGRQAGVKIPETENTHRTNFIR